jgi:hypothetical protein
MPVKIFAMTQKKLRPCRTCNGGVVCTHRHVYEQIFVALLAKIHAGTGCLD